MTEVNDFSTDVANFVTENFTAFFADGNGPKLVFDSCLEAAVSAFEDIYEDDTTEPNTGSLPELDDIYQECKDEIDNFNLKVISVLDEQIADYIEDARNQKNIVATDFANVLETTLFKIHEGLSDLTDEELDIINMAIMNERDNMESDVAGWFSAFMSAATDISTTLMGDLDTKASDFEEDIDETLKMWLADLNDDL